MKKLLIIAIAIIGIVFTNSPDQTTGTGLTDGVLHYSDQNPEFYYYELEEQTVITNLSEWESQTP
jgi:hypothetical protein